MTLPGTEVTIQDEPAGRFPPGDTATWFVAGLAERGSVTEPVPVRSLAAYGESHGSRASFATSLYDALDVFFREGGSLAYVLRVVGPDAVYSSVILNDASSGPEPSLAITANSPGEWGDGLEVVVSAGGGAGTFRLAIKLDGATVESSPDLASVDEAVAWAGGSAYVTVDAVGELDPDTGTFSLAGGDDDRANIDDDQWQEALDRVTKDYGPGQVSAPGMTTSNLRAALVAHAASHNRVALVDSPDPSTASELAADAAELRDDASASVRFAAQFSPWVVVPGIAAGTTRTVPYSALEAGLIARSEGLGNDPNVPAAGAQVPARYAIGLSQDAFTDEEREQLNNAGVNVGRSIRGQVRTYGYRTLVNPVTDPKWVEFSGSRVVMAILAEADAIAEQFLFSQIDGRGIKLGEFGGELQGVCAKHYQAGALYGETPQEAFAVNVGSQVNTPETLAARELHAVLELRTSPFAERVEIALVRRVVTESV